MDFDPVCVDDCRTVVHGAGDRGGEGSRRARQLGDRGCDRTRLLERMGGVHTVRELLAAHNDTLRARGLSPALLPDRDPSLDAVPAKGERTRRAFDFVEGSANILAEEESDAVGERRGGGDFECGLAVVPEQDVELRIRQGDPRDDLRDVAELSRVPLQELLAGGDIEEEMPGLDPRPRRAPRKWPGSRYNRSRTASSSPPRSTSTSA